MVEKEAGMVSSYEILHKKQVKQKQRAQKLLKDKEAKELKECTFTPTIISKKKSLNYLPGTENKIQMPSESSLKQKTRTFLHDDSSPQQTLISTRRIRQPRNSSNTAPQKGLSSNNKKYKSYKQLPDPMAQQFS